MQRTASCGWSICRAGLAGWQAGEPGGWLTGMLVWQALCDVGRGLDVPWQHAIVPEHAISPPPSGPRPLLPLLPPVLFVVLPLQAAAS